MSWGKDTGQTYPVEVEIIAHERSGLLRDITEVFAKEKVNVTAAHTQSVKGSGAATAWMTFTVEVPGSDRLAAVLKLVAQVAGVRSARRK